jgi:ubiquinone/menaquinone biosynthesis C-methylase UbiE
MHACGDWLAEILKRKKFEARGYGRILKLTRVYHNEFSDYYVNFYGDWLKGEGGFSDPKYKEGYDMVAKVLHNTAKSGEKVVDVGCGVGVWSTLLAKKGVYVTSLDNSSKMLKKSAERSKNFELKSRISLILSDGLHIPFKDEPFDGATLNWVLAHIPVSRNLRFMNEVSRVVKQKGWLFISDSYWRGQKGGKEQTQIRKTGGRKYEVYKYYYDTEELKRLLAKTFGEIELLQPLQYELICLAKKS